MYYLNMHELYLDDSVFSSLQFFTNEIIFINNIQFIQPGGSFFAKFSKFPKYFLQQSFAPQYAFFI